MCNFLSAKLEGKTIESLYDPIIISLATFVLFVYYGCSIIYSFTIIRFVYIVYLFQKIIKKKKNWS